MKAPTLLLKLILPQQFRMLLRTLPTPLFCHIVIPPVNEDDFKYIFTKDSLIVFGYSSVVGYTELYLYDHQEKELMISKKLDEADQLDKSSFKTATMSFEVSNYADSIITKKLQKIDWDRCQQ